MCSKLRERFFRAKAYTMITNSGSIAEMKVFILVADKGLFGK